MSWRDLDPTIHAIADQHLTPRQRRALQLAEDGHSYRTIALHLDCGTSTAWDTVRRARHIISLHLRPTPP